MLPPANAALVMKDKAKICLHTAPDVRIWKSLPSDKRIHCCNKLQNVKINREKYIAEDTAQQKNPLVTINAQMYLAGLLQSATQLKKP